MKGLTTNSSAGPTNRACHHLKTLFGRRQAHALDGFLAMTSSNLVHGQKRFLGHIQAAPHGMSYNWWSPE